MSSGDVAFTADIESATFINSSYFNPGSRNVLHADIAVSLEFESVIEQVEEWIDNGETNTDDISINVTWNAYECDDDGDNCFIISNTSSFVDDAEILNYNSFELQYENDDDDDGNATLVVNSYFVLNADNIISTDSYTICDAYDDSVFKSDTYYQFEIEIQITTDDAVNGMVSKSENSVFLTNTPPQGGNCTISPTNGILFEDSYYVKCLGWTDGNSTELTYKYFYDESLNLNLDNENENTIDYIGYGNHTITVAILDELNLATCVDLVASASFDLNSTNFLNSDTSDFTSWLTGIYTNLTDESSDITNVLLLSQISYDLMNVYIDNDESQFDQEFVDLQEYVTNNVVNVSLSVIDSSSSDVFSSMINILASISEPFDEVITSSSTSRRLQDSYTYSSSTVNNIMNFLSVALVNASSNQSIDDTDDADSVTSILDNSLLMRLNLDDEEDSYDAITNGQTMIDTLNSVSSSLLGDDAVVGEFYNSNSSTYSLQTAKISSTTSITKIDSLCNSDNNNGNSISVSGELLSITSDNGNFDMNCVMMTTPYNIYNISDVDQWYADFLNFDLFTSNSSENTTSTTTTLSSCEPVILTFNVTNGSNFSNSDSDDFPLCSFFNETNQTFDTDGCYVISMSNDGNTVRCSCLHLTFFSLSSEEFTPEIDYEIFYEIDNISLETLSESRVGWVTVTAWLVLIAILIILFDKWKPFKIYDRPMIAHKLSGRVAKTMHLYKHKFREQIVDMIMMNPDLTPKQKIGQLWWINIKNDHQFLGLFMRDFGTNFTYTGRLLFVCVRLLTTMAVSGIVSCNDQISKTFFSFFTTHIVCYPKVLSFFVV